MFPSLKYMNFILKILCLCNSSCTFFPAHVYYIGDIKKCKGLHKWKDLKIFTDLLAITVFNQSFKYRYYQHINTGYCLNYSIFIHCLLILIMALSLGVYLKLITFINIYCIHIFLQNFFYHISRL